MFYCYYVMKLPINAVYKIEMQFFYTFFQVMWYIYNKALFHITHYSTTIMKVVQVNSSFIMFTDISTKMRHCQYPYSNQMLYTVLRNLV